MLQAMAAAEVGDDVFGEDPTMNRLQERMAKLFAKEQGMFVPSGTMGNEICIKVHTQPGDEIIVDEDSHIVVYETAAPAILSGVQIKTLASTNGIMAVSDLERALRPSVYYMPRTRLICLENTHGRSGGSIIPLEYIKELSTFARSRDIRLHLDGARLWNASVATGIPVRDYARFFDTVSVCFSKGLGAPIGSMVLGDARVIEQARKYRKIFGGGMRQVGVLGAAALYALDHNIERLKEDHAKAQGLGKRLADIRSLSLQNPRLETNMIIANISGTGKTQDEILNVLKNNGILLTPERSDSIRAVTHLDVSLDDVRQAGEIFAKLFK